MKRLALLSACLVGLACSDGGGKPDGGQGGGHAGTTGTGAAGGSAGTAGNTGSAGTTGTGGQMGGSTGTAGRGGTTGTGGQTGGTTGNGGAGGRGGSGGSTGTGGRGGSTGTGGAGGQGGTGGNGQTCAQIESDYGMAFMRARMCNAAQSAEPCIYLVPSSLSCGCQSWVKNTTELDAIHAQWTAAGCTGGIACPLACVNPGARGLCVAVSSGDFCMGTN